MRKGRSLSRTVLCDSDDENEAQKYLVVCLSVCVCVPGLRANICSLLKKLRKDFELQAYNNLSYTDIYEWRCIYEHMKV